jgi:hypothetical protein
MKGDEPMTALEPDPIANQRRKTRRRTKLAPNAACAFCGETTPEALLLANRSLLERHHVVGAANADELTVPLCRNCHAIQTEGMRDVGVDLRHQARQLPELVVSVLRALGVFFRSLGDHLLDWAERLAALFAGLDRDCPGWRQLPEAQA